ncbi:hypothetical protein BT63DRAFT_266551 [Microthyrium microscopicum]|uniref:Uncharacterized protein n=1 Tax=Microthyrium microscopicum TaxID=703497 RepID=A0A6A6UBN5_9PEZI|nr:hypothetical protein BT63DRAFT_266551 [Microthyrium microscopicum]
MANNDRNNKNSRPGPQENSRITDPSLWATFAERMMALALPDNIDIPRARFPSSPWDRFMAQQQNRTAHHPESPSLQNTSNQPSRGAPNEHSKPEVGTTHRERSARTGHTSTKSSQATRPKDRAKHASSKPRAEDRTARPKSATTSSALDEQMPDLLPLQSLISRPRAKPSSPTRPVQPAAAKQKWLPPPAPKQISPAKLKQPSPTRLKQPSLTRLKQPSLTKSEPSSSDKPTQLSSTQSKEPYSDRPEISESDQALMDLQKQLEKISLSSHLQASHSHRRMAFSEEAPESGNRPIVRPAFPTDKTHKPRGDSTTSHLAPSGLDGLLAEAANEPLIPKPKAIRKDANIPQRPLYSEVAKQGERTTATGALRTAAPKAIIRPISQRPSQNPLRNESTSQGEIKRAASAESLSNTTTLGKASLPSISKASVATHRAPTDTAPVSSAPMAPAPPVTARTVQPAFDDDIADHEEWDFVDPNEANIPKGTRITTKGKIKDGEKPPVWSPITRPVTRWF